MFSGVAVGGGREPVKGWKQLLSQGATWRLQKVTLIEDTRQWTLADLVTHWDDLDFA